MIMKEHVTCTFWLTNVLSYILHNNGAVWHIEIRFLDTDTVIYEDTLHYITCTWDS